MSHIVVGELQARRPARVVRIDRHRHAEAHQAGAGYGLDAILELVCDRIDEADGDLLDEVLAHVQEANKTPRMKCCQPPELAHRPAGAGHPATIADRKPRSGRR